MLKTFDTRIIAVGNTELTTENKRYIDFAAKMVLTDFGRGLECRLGRLVRKLESEL
jgi:hypothetical protein